MCFPFVEVLSFASTRIHDVSVSNQMNTSKNYQAIMSYFQYSTIFVPVVNISASVTESIVVLILQNLTDSRTLNLTAVSERDVSTV